MVVVIFLFVFGGSLPGVLVVSGGGGNLSIVHLCQGPKRRSTDFFLYLFFLLASHYFFKLRVCLPLSSSLQRELHKEVWGTALALLSSLGCQGGKEGGNFAYV